MFHGKREREREREKLACSSAPKVKNSGREKEVKRSNNDNYGAVNRYGKQNENHKKIL
jgi:hypothetical protein